MNAKWRFVLTLVIGFTVIGAFWFFSQAISAVTGYSIGNTRFDEFAKCLADSGAVLYISSNDCESCGKSVIILKLNLGQHG